VNQQTIAAMSPQELLAPGLRALETVLTAAADSEQAHTPLPDERRQEFPIEKKSTERDPLPATKQGTSSLSLL